MYIGSDSGQVHGSGFRSKPISLDTIHIFDPCDHVSTFFLLHFTLTQMYFLCCHIISFFSFFSSYVFSPLLCKFISYIFLICLTIHKFNDRNIFWKYGNASSGKFYTFFIFFSHFYRFFFFFWRVSHHSVTRFHNRFL